MTQMTEEEFFAIWQNQKTEQVELEYRLYYDERGAPLFYSTEKLEGQYIVVDRQTYINGDKHIRVLDGKITRIKTTYGKKLAPALQGQPCDPRDICVIVEDPNKPVLNWAVKHEEIKNDQTS